MKRKAIFLTHRQALYSEITGGVQLCSQEFHHLLEEVEELELEDYYVPSTRNIFQRGMIRLGLENYSMYDVAKDTPSLLEHIEKNHIGIVFINMASLVRYARPVRDAFGGRVKIVLLSHGNHSGDFLHLITKPVKAPSALKRGLQKIRLGWLIATEATHRVRYLDGVITLSETERQIENWFGARRSVFLPRRLYTEFLEHVPIPGRVGFVGRLDHPPNLQGMSILLDQVRRMDHSRIKVRLVGAPTSYGRDLQERYPFIEYLGELSDADLEKEVASWSLLLNPVWWYSTGASTKLARAISWGVPIVSTPAGMRGYEWKEGALLMADTPEEMTEQILKVATDPAAVLYWAGQTRTIAQNGPALQELVNKLKHSYQ